MVFARSFGFDMENVWSFPRVGLLGATCISGTFAIWGSGIGIIGGS